MAALPTEVNAHRIAATEDTREIGNDLRSADHELTNRRAAFHLSSFAASNARSRQTIRETSFAPVPMLRRTPVAPDSTSRTMMSIPVEPRARA